MVGKSPSSAEGAASVPSSGAGTPHASVPKNKTKWKQCCGQFNTEFKNKNQTNGPHQKKIFKKIKFFKKWRFAVLDVFKF